MLIDVSYFTAGPRHILNATLGTQSSEVNDAIMNYVIAWQLPFLVELLGVSVGNALHDYLVAKDDGDYEPDEDMESLAKRVAQSFADYVFFRIIGENNTQASTKGIVRLKCANEYVSPVSRQVSVWNGMVEKNRLFEQWCKSDMCNVSGIAISSNLLKPINRFNL